VLARAPLASGLLSGRYDSGTRFGADDHRSFNRSGQAFDVGETFSGVPYDVGVAAAQQLRGRHAAPAGRAAAGRARRRLRPTGAAARARALVTRVAGVVPLRDREPPRVR
jgi:hypothetical protein